MTDILTCHAGDIVLLRAEIVGVGSDGPYVIGSCDLLLGANCISRPD